MSQGEYTFKVLKESSSLAGTGKLMNMPSPERAEEYGRSVAAFRGALLSLFGEPIWTTGLLEESFEYVIEVTDRQGHSWIMAVYQGPSGPAIGGDPRDETIYPVAEALLRLIEATPPADFEEVVYYKGPNSLVAI